MADPKLSIFSLGIAAAFAVVACGHQDIAAKDPNSIEAFMSTPSATPSDAPPPSTDSDAKGSDDGGGSRLNAEQKKQMEVTLDRGQRKAAQCPDVVADMPAGETDVQVVFDGQKGRVTDVKVGAPYAGTPGEACIKRAFVDEIIVPFDGDPITVPFTVKIPAKKAAETTDKKAEKGKKK